MTDKPAHMWPYWRDDKGLSTAAYEYYPEAFAKEQILKVAMMQIHLAKTTIDAYFRAKADPSTEDGED